MEVNVCTTMNHLKLLVAIVMINQNLYFCIYNTHNFCIQHHVTCLLIITNISCDQSLALAVDF